MSLEDFRARIDSFDREIIRLLNDRAEVVQQVGEFKRENNQKVFDPARERHIFERLKELNSGPVTDACLSAVYREIISGSYELERKFRVSFLGPDGTFSHLAAHANFGSSVEYITESDIRSVFMSVAKDNTDYGVVPVQNALDGGITDALDSFVEVDVTIISELNLPISQCLLSNHPREEITNVYSKPQALAQCRRFLRENLPDAALVDEASTARAAQRAASEQGAAAVANDMAARIYGLQVVERAIEDGPINVTRFVVLGNEQTRQSGQDKTAILFVAHNEPGALCNMLLPLKERSLNILWLDYRPSKEHQWGYVFFLDIEGHKDDPQVSDALQVLTEQASYLRVLGSFPVAESLGVLAETKQDL